MSKKKKVAKAPPVVTPIVQEAAVAIVTRQLGL